MKKRLSLSFLVLALCLTGCATNNAQIAKLSANVLIDTQVTKHCVSTGPQSLTFTAPDCTVVTTQAQALAGVLIDVATKTTPSESDIAVAKQGLSDFLTFGPPHFPRVDADLVAELIYSLVNRPKT